MGMVTLVSLHNNKYYWCGSTYDERDEASLNEVVKRVEQILLRGRGHSWGPQQRNLMRQDRHLEQFPIKGCKTD